MQSLFLVMAGGGVGAGTRYWLSGLIAARWGNAFPFATLTINIIGCFAMGLLAAWLVREGGNEPLRLALGVGLLGGFTTFSAFGLDWWQLVERGAIGAALVYAAASLIATLLAFGCGLFLGRAAL